jgi:hypothetical protein
MTKTWSACCCALLLACGGVPAQDAEYPETKVRSNLLGLEIQEQRKEVLERIDVVGTQYQNEKVTFPQPLPAGFEAGARQRLDRLASGSGLTLVVTTLIERADVVFWNDHDGNHTRYEVTLGFRITSEQGLLIQKGKGSSVQELPSEEATPKEMQRVFLVAALNAFDQYFAAEETLGRLNQNIDAYLKQHPGEAH